MSRIVTPEIQSIVAAHYGIPAREMRSACRRRAHARPRQVAMWFSRQLTERSYPEIGRRFGGRDHSTVMHGVRTIDRMLREDVEIRYDVEVLAGAFAFRALLLASIIAVRVQP